MKTRLAESIGKERAEEFFLLSVKATEALVIEATDKEGRVVRIVVAADDSETAKVAITHES